MKFTTTLLAEVQSTLSMFTHNKIIEDLSDNHIHRLENIVSMNIASHQLFNELYLWLKPVKVCSSFHSLCCPFLYWLAGYTTQVLFVCSSR